MSLVLVTGGLAPGRDGIGDYCRVIATALADAGARPALLALADSDEAVGAEAWPCLRLAAARPWAERVERAQRFLQEHSPTQIFLQLSPYLYQPRGLLQRAVPALTQLLARYRPLIMVHETWVGELPYHGWKDRLIGPWQRRGFLASLRGLQPTRVFTSLPLYRRQLAKPGVATELLPLPGNVPVATERAGAWLTLPPGPVAGIFGSLWPKFEPDRALDDYRRAAGGTATLLLIGRHGASAERLAAWRQQHPGLGIVETGEIDAARVSQCLNALHFAFGVSPWELAGKSGTIAALLEHGVPVLASWGDARQPSGVPADRASLLLPPGAPVAPLLQREPGSGPFRPMTPAIAERLLAALAATCAAVL